MKTIFGTFVAVLFGEPHRPRSPLALYAPVVVAVLAVFVAVRPLRRTAALLLAPHPLRTFEPAARDGVRFGLPEATRREIFAEIARAEPQARANGRSSFPGPELAWSAEDHRGAFERKTVAALAARHRVTLQQIYLVLDEGIRERWPAPESGEPLDPHSVPLKPRRRY